MLGHRQRPAAARSERRRPRSRRVMSASSGFSPGRRPSSTRGSSAIPQIGTAAGSDLRPPPGASGRCIRHSGAGVPGAGVRGATPRVPRCQVLEASAACCVLGAAPDAGCCGAACAGARLACRAARARGAGTFRDRPRTSCGSPESRSSTSCPRARAIRRAGAPGRPACRTPDRSRMQDDRNGTRRSIIVRASRPPR